MTISLCSVGLKCKVVNKEIDVKKYTYKIDNIRKSFLIAVVADLHDREPGEAIEVVRKQKPDVILLPGDTFERRDADIAGFEKSEIDNWMKTSIAWRIVCKCIKVYSDLTGITTRMSREYSASNGRRLLNELSKIAPCIMSVGNHEWYFLDEDYSVINDNNVILLDNSASRITIKNQTVFFWWAIYKMRLRMGKKIFNI